MDSLEMGEELWSGLPSEIHERLLSFLSLPVLCRFQTVCKRWNSLISSSHFRALCTRNAKAPQGFILGRCAATLPGTPQYSKSLGWRLLDVTAKRWYFIKHDEDDSYHTCESRSLAMDGGLVCAYYLDPLAAQNSVIVHVSNHIAKVSTRLSASPYDAATRDGALPVSQRISSLMSMVVDQGHGHVAENYKIFVIRCAQHESSVTPSVVAYNSSTSSWHPSSTNLARVAGIRDTFLVRCIAFFDGSLYVLISNMTHHGDQFWQLWSYNLDVDAWTKTGAKNCLPSALLHPQLIVSDNRLFLVSWETIVLGTLCTMNHFPMKTFCLMEILLVGRAPLFDLSESRMGELFQTDFREETPTIVRQFETAYEYCFADSPDVSAFGFEKSIVLISRKSGVSQEYDVVTRSWIAEQPFKALPCDDHDLWYGQPMSLILHPGVFSQLRKRRQDGPICLSDDEDKVCRCVIDLSGNDLDNV